MNEINLAGLGITKEDIEDKAASKIAEMIVDYDGLSSRVEKMIEKRVKESVQSALLSRVDEKLQEVMEQLLHEEIVPVNIWGERQGEPTTIKAALSERAREFWQVRVEKDGKPSTYGGKPRHEWLMAEVTRKEFENAIKENINEVVAAFKEAMRKDAGQWLGEYIGNVFPKQTRR